MSSQTEGDGQAKPAEEEKSFTIDFLGTKRGKCKQCASCKKYALKQLSVRQKMST